MINTALASPLDMVESRQGMIITGNRYQVGQQSVVAETIP